MFRYKKLCLMILSLPGSLSQAVVIDVVIPCHEKDLITLEQSIDGIKKYVADVRRVIVVSSKRLTNKAEWFDECDYPFTKQDLLEALFHGDKQLLARHRNNRGCRVGWLYQQLLKLYAPLIIPDIAENVLIVDADAIFINNVSFIDGGYALYGYRFLKPREYENHRHRLLPFVIDRYPKTSGVVHHMLLQRQVLNDLFVEAKQASGKEFWQAFCSAVDLNLALGGKVNTLASEYQIYFEYIFSIPGKYKVKVRKLRGVNIANLSCLNLYRKRGFVFAANHDYMRGTHKDKLIP